MYVLMVLKDHLLFRRYEGRKKKNAGGVLEVRKAFREGFRLCLCYSIVADSAGQEESFAS